jgi:hypothetical protein
MINVDGTGRTALTNTSSNSENHSTFSPDSGSVAFERDGGADPDVFIVNATTKAVSHVALGQTPSWNPTDNEIWIHGTSGWSAFSPAGVLDSHLTYSDTVTQYHAGPGHYQSAFFFGGNLHVAAGDTLDKNLATGIGGSIGGFSPDGQRVLLSQFENDSATFQLVTLDGVSGATTRLTSDLYDYTEPFWGRLPASTVLVGSSNALALSASGIIYAQAGDDLTATLAFKATTQSTVVVAAPGQQFPGSNITYTIDADDLTNISYSNGTMLRPIRVVGSGASVGDANGAIVSINSATGKIVNVLAFAGNRGPKPTITRDGSDTVFKGTFNVVMDQSGKDLAKGRTLSVVRLTSKGEVTAN